MSRKTTIILALLLALAGIAVLAYPAFSNYLNQRNGSYAIQELNDTLEQVESEEIARQRRQAEAYNAALAAGETPEGYGEILDFGEGVMGYIRIPKIGVSLPICHGVSEEVLATSVGHMPQSAFPIGGAGNHSILTGHTGLPSAELFTDLTELEPGDSFYIRILGDTLTYQVDQITVVLPSEVKKLAAVPGEDHCTLVTCTPYGVNTHRLLVRGIRVEETEADAAISQTVQEVPLPIGLAAALAAAVILLAAIFVVIFRKG